MKKQYYVVWTGLVPGVYANWKETEKQVKGYSGAQYSGGFVTRAEAEAAFKAEYEKWLKDKENKDKGGPPLF